ncbi:hypothetical protein ACROYT_G018421 [Oculina patagonica]
MAAFSFAILFKSAALVASVSLFAVSDGCTFKSDCEVNQVCCDFICVYASSCVRRFCPSDSGCSSGESCCANECVYGSSCVNRSCSYKSDCSSGESCCKSKCVYGSNCAGQSCSSHSDCSSGERCCNSECKDGYHCVGSSCSTDSDCGTLGTCCNGKCQRSDDCINSAAAVIAGAVIGPLAVICAITMCFFYVRRRQRTLSYGRVIEVERAVITATSTTTVANIQSNPPFPGQEIPPSYPYHPPLELHFEHQQHTTNPPPYHPGTMAASKQPPPYTEAPKKVSGGVNAPSPSFSSAAPPPVLQQH